MKALAYFEDWSRRPGQQVRMAISSELSELQAGFVQIVSGPGDLRIRKRSFETCRRSWTKLWQHALR